MLAGKPFKRSFRIGQLVLLPDSVTPMQVIKYEDKVSAETGKPIVSVTWKEKKVYKIARFNEDELIPFSKFITKD